ncbi:hypothetical protein U9M48_022765 [Paspalum notatum var. saurae]|uniref:Leucine-rich repeat-containing N-terminal plant-type domain-containing protein n=1 Tax=Paspalum notatum var. saurae TaxID=547442 RepID=A0AAQ3TIW9_PASNO
MAVKLRYGVIGNFNFLLASKTKQIKRTAGRTEVPAKCTMRHSKPPGKLAMLIVLPLLLLCYGVGNVHCATVHENSQDFHSLLDFKKGITNDPNEVLNNWTNNTHFCRWNGVNCTLTPPYRVTELILRGHNLAGQISPSLGNLTFLNVLDLSTNNFRGVIPDALTNCSNLAELGLYANNLTGVIPPSIGLLTKLEQLLFENNLYGVIPPGLGNITDLSIIDLAENQLNGPIPSDFWQMPKIAQLYLGNNNLSVP